MASKDEISNITTILPNLSTKEDIDMLVEKLKDKVDLTETNEFKIQIDTLNQNQAMYVRIDKYEEKIISVEDLIRSFEKTKVDAK